MLKSKTKKCFRNGGGGRQVFLPNILNLPIAYFPAVFRIQFRNNFFI